VLKDPQPPRLRALPVTIVRRALSSSMIPLAILVRRPQPVLALLLLAQLALVATSADKA